ncbi:MAG: VanW family protein [Eubacteriales bacterium]|nr:VanW family protein [Eubacteriales bacterium]
MKALIAAFVVLLFLFGCAGNQEKNLTPQVSKPPKPQVTAPPEETPKDLEEPEDPIEPVEETLSAFYTKIVDSSKARLKNIQLANEALNKAIVQSGDIFSFNDVVGPRTADRGYQEAPIIIDEEKEMGIGGGVCQVSTTLYNAALAGGLEIIERHQHSAEVGYIELGRDATVSYGGYDLKFKNTLPYPIKFQAGLGKDTESIKIIVIKS